MNRLADCMQECCQYIFYQGYQTCFAIHSSDKGNLHVHLVISTTNFTTGYKLKRHPTALYLNIQKPILDIFQKNTLSPYSIADAY